MHSTLIVFPNFLIIYPKWNIKIKQVFHFYTSMSSYVKNGAIEISAPYSINKIMPRDSRDENYEAAHQFHHWFPSLKKARWTAVIHAVKESLLSVMCVIHGNR